MAFFEELCYNIRYVEKPDGKLGKKWSLRQAGIYHQIDPETRRSSWILLQPSENLRKRLHENLNYRQSNQQDRDASPMLLHALFLSTLAYNWVDYIEDLRMELAVLVSVVQSYQVNFTKHKPRQDDKACFSKVGVNKPHDFSITFADTQKLQLLRQKLLRAKFVLESCLDVAKSCKSHCHSLDGFGFASSKALISLNVYSAQIELALRTLGVLLQCSQGTATLVFLFFLECM